MLSPAATKPARSRRTGRYVMGRRIGAGGMATVFAARQNGPLGLGRLVALKVMSSALVGDELVEKMFVREAGISARLEHDNIVRVYEVDEADGAYFIAMELVVGATLRDIGCDRAPPLPVTLAIVGQVADALHYAHALRAPSGEPLRIVHQDVTPHNVMVTYSGVTKLLDFGVARIGHLDASRTETIRGKPAYLAPEQLLSERIDRRTDIFALGIILHELLSGERLFRADNELSTFDAVLKKSIPRPTGVPTAIADVCLQALARRPEDRFDTAGDMARALRDAARAAGVHPASREELADWLKDACPPRWSLEELERETISEEARAHRIEAVQDLPTRSTVIAPAAAPEPTRPRFALVVAAAVAVGLGLGVGAFALTRDASPSASVDARSASVVESPPAADARSGAREVPRPEGEAAAVAEPKDPKPDAPAPLEPAPPERRPDELPKVQPENLARQTTQRRPPSASARPPAAPPSTAPPVPLLPPPADHGIPTTRD